MFEFAVKPAVYQAREIEHFMDILIQFNDSGRIIMPF
jgi:hypothetical protein